MGKVRTDRIKRISRSLIEKYPDKFKNDFENNKKILEEVTIIRSKKMRNRIAGYISRITSGTTQKNGLE